LMLAQQMPFGAVARTIGESWHRVHAICRRSIVFVLPCARARRICSPPGSGTTSPAPISSLCRDEAHKRGSRAGVQAAAFAGQGEPLQLNYTKATPALVVTLPPFGCGLVELFSGRQLRRDRDGSGRLICSRQGRHLSVRAELKFASDRGCLGRQNPNPFLLDLLDICATV
jgi:hypothetical protein